MFAGGGGRWHHLSRDGLAYPPEEPLLRSAAALRCALPHL